MMNPLFGKNLLSVDA